jgi:hypothetical protein
LTPSAQFVEQRVVNHVPGVQDQIGARQRIQHRRR